MSAAGAGSGAGAGEGAGSSTASTTPRSRRGAATGGVEADGGATVREMVAELGTASPHELRGLLRGCIDAIIALRRSDRDKAARVAKLDLQLAERVSEVEGLNAVSAQGVLRRSAKPGLIFLSLLPSTGIASRTNRL